MTVSNQDNRTSVVGTGAEQEIPFTFPITSTSDITVYKRLITSGEETKLDETADYTVTIDGTSGGTVTTVTPFFASTYQIHIIRDTPMTQSLDLVQGGSFNAENIETALDKSVRLIIENSNSLDRTLRFPETDADSIMEELPKASTRAGKFLYFGASDGNPSVAESITTGETTISPFGKTLIDDDNASAALTTLGFTPFGKTLIDDASAVIARGTLGLHTDDAVEFAAITGTTGTFTDIITKGPYIDVRAFGAIGNGVADDTVVIQAAIDAAGYVNMAHSSGTAPTLVGGKGKPILFPPGIYKVTGTLYYYPGQTIYGYGMQSCISFEPITALKDLFTPKAAVGVGANNIFRTVYFKNLLFTCNSVYGQKAIHFDEVTRWAVDDLCIQGFKYGIHNEGVASKFFNRITSTFFRDCETSFANEGSVCKIDNSIFSSKSAGGLWEATSNYAITNSAIALTIINCDFEGEITAHIYSQDRSGLHVVGNYYEDAPLVLYGMDRDTTTWGQTNITGNWGLKVLVKFEDLMETPTENFRYPHGVSLGGNYRLLNLIANSSAKRGSIGWDVTNGAITYSPDAFMSRFAWRLTADGGGACYISQTTATQFERPLPARFTVTFLAKKSHSTDSMIYSNVSTDIVHRAREVIDYGNDWFLYALNIENTDELFADTQIIIRLTDAAGGTPTNGHYVDISNIRIYEGEGFDIFPGDTESEAETISDAAPADGTWEQREKVWITAPAGSSHPGWMCITSGTFSDATDNAGDTDGITATITGMADTSDFFVGQYITTSAGFPNSVDDGNVPVKIISKTATTLVIDDTSDSAVNNITVLTPDPVFKDMADLGA